MYSQGADINALDSLGLSPLAVSVKPRDPSSPGSRHVPLFLLDMGARITGRNPQVKWELIEHSVVSGNLSLVKMLLSKGLNVDGEAKENTPLHSAVLHGYLEIAEHLIKSGANIEARCIRGETPLHWAANVGDERMIELLLANEAKIYSRNNRGETPEEVLKRRGFYSLINLFPKVGNERN